MRNIVTTYLVRLVYASVLTACLSACGSAERSSPSSVLVNEASLGKSEVSVEATVAVLNRIFTRQVDGKRIGVEVGEPARKLVWKETFMRADGTAFCDLKRYDAKVENDQLVKNEDGTFVMIERSLPLTIRRGKDGGIQLVIDAGAADEGVYDATLVSDREIRFVNASTGPSLYNDGSGNPSRWIVEKSGIRALLTDEGRSEYRIVGDAYEVDAAFVRTNSMLDDDGAVILDPAGDPKQKTFPTSEIAGLISAGTLTFDEAYDILWAQLVP